ncbi:GNAT family N-acetyltransferase [Bacteroides fragilis]|uniref:GNAT family N-acetyltransferase n=1 Tax=Bacteroides hominis TaxID=2763023 RepID=UPI00229B9AB0|nr:GNAT family N-acetyltransferase [Bacteroides fragilis]MCS2879392.1 GNAT family N-acetyltransferase [Bacteroides fragilis]MCY6331567.1 GNAT family N-acetyltransferase [Bacteroides fragilis]
MKMYDMSSCVNSVFEQVWWLKAVSPDREWKEVFIEEDGQIIARWVSVVNNNDLILPAQTQTLGFWIHPEILKNDKYYNKRKEIIYNLITQLPSKSVLLSLAPENTYFLPFIWKRFNISPRISYRIMDLSNIDSIYNTFGKVVKKNIKSAKNKVNVCEIDDISLLHNLMNKTFALQRRKYPYTIDFLNRIYGACKQHNACKLLYAIDKENNIHSGALFVYDKHVCYYLIAGTDPDYRSSGANTLLIWEGIQLAAKFSQCFDFEGSMIEGIEKFIRQFGGVPVTYYEIKRCGVVQDFWAILKPRIKRIIGYK